VPYLIYCIFFSTNAEIIIISICGALFLAKEAVQDQVYDKDLSRRTSISDGILLKIFILQRLLQ
jgi:hypothetical protein